MMKRRPRYVVDIGKVINAFLTRGEKPEGKNKVKVKFTVEQATKAQRYSSTLSLNSALNGGGWSRPLPGRFTPIV